MGQEESKPVDESILPQRLKKRDIASVAKYIKDGRAKRIVVMTGAGISTSAGIPDFRSPDTGLYANLARLDLPYPEAVFDLSYFRQNPIPFYTLAHELFVPGKFYPTIAHTFIRLLHDKGMLLKLFTQNIDCLEREAGVPEEKIVEAHGSWASHRCIECKSPFPRDLMEKTVKERQVPYCLRPDCAGLVKPDIVFFGEQLPEAFALNRTLPAAADLCIVMGTSLSVYPFAGLPAVCADGVPRVLINSEAVGGLGSRSDDVLILGDCDAGVRKLAAELGWLEELEALWAKTQPEKPMEELDDEYPPKTKDQKVEDEVERLTAEVDRALKISSDHEKHVRSQLQQHQVGSEDKEVLRIPEVSEDTVKPTLTQNEVAEVAEGTSKPVVQNSEVASVVQDQSESTSKTDLGKL
ncbi:MAG: hypothetical protein M1823_002361 [Watsoniomyces obsoletus]|nr:MAG: hypothetical protein M1823_002361 [Watsoniomyces obsoletus]